jgi:hypothetical protein
MLPAACGRTARGLELAMTIDTRHRPHDLGLTVHHPPPTGKNEAMDVPRALAATLALKRVGFELNCLQRPQPGAHELHGAGLS